MALSNVHGFPRIGRERELKFATEGYWSGETSAEELRDTARAIRRESWGQMREAGISLIPSNDFSYYDQVLDATALVGAVPERYGWEGGEVDLETYFAMARGRQDAPAMEMTKWYDTNYHYIVPELWPDTRFALSGTQPFDHYLEARGLGIETKPVLVGPVTYLLLGKAGSGVPEDFDRLSLLEPLLDVYAEAIGRVGELGADWVELHEPAFVQDRTEAELHALRRAYERLSGVRGRPWIAVATYFDHAGETLPVLRDLPVEGVGLDFTRAGAHNLELLREAGGVGGKALFAGIVDGRNIWINDLRASLGLLDELDTLAGEVVVSTSCSLQHVPIDLATESSLDDELRGWMAFARQKLDELAVLAGGGDPAAAAAASPLPDDHDRLLSPDRRHPPDARQAAAGGDRRGRVPAHHARGDREGRSLPGRPGSRRPRARRAGAQRHGPVLRGADGRLRDHRDRLGPVVRVALWATADPLRRRGARRPDHRRVDQLRAVAHREAREGNAYRTGDDAAVVVRARRPAALGDLQAASTRDPRRGGGPGGGRPPGHPGGRARDPRRPAAAPRALGRVPGLGRALLPAGHLRGQGRDTDPDPHVLLGVPRHHGQHQRARCRRVADLARAVPPRAARVLEAQGLRQGHLPGRLRHPLAAGALRRRDGRDAARGGRGPAARAPVGGPGLRTEDAPLRGCRTGAAQHGRRGSPAPRGDGARVRLIGRRSGSNLDTDLSRLGDTR